MKNYIIPKQNNMNKFKGTKKLRYLRGGFNFLILNSKWVNVLSTQTNKKSVAEANARLFCAAPELLDLAIEMFEYLQPKQTGQINSINTSSIFHQQLEQVISKALGE